MEKGLTGRKNADLSVPSQNAESESVKMVVEPGPPAVAMFEDGDSSEDEDLEQGERLNRGTFLIQDLTPDFEDDEADIEGLTIGPDVRDSMNNIRLVKKDEAQFNVLTAETDVPRPLEVEVLVYTTVEEEVALNKTLAEDAQSLEEKDTNSIDAAKIKELKEKLGKANVPSRNPYISSTTFDVRYQLGQAGGRASGTQSPGKKKPSRWRRFLRGFHRRISFLLPSALKKETKPKVNN